MQVLIVLRFSDDNTEDEAGVEKNCGGAVKTEFQGEKQRRLSLKKGKARENFSFSKPSFNCKLEIKL